VVALRRGLYRAGVLRVQHVPVPVVVVGNLTVGGTGKTPVTAWLARQLALRGHRVGVVLRGYGGRGARRARVVTAASDPAEVGDEAVLHALRGPQVVVAGADRVAAARLAAEQGAELVVCDDGLQHLRLGRDCEIVVVDAARGFGNRQLLPAGPLREPAERVEQAQAVVITQRTGATPAVTLRRALGVVARLRPGDAVNLASGERRPLESFRGRPVQAVAGIGHPQAFFDGLRAAGLELVEHVLPDHAPLERDRLPFPPPSTVLMTEKDAVKCRGFADAEWWFVELEVSLGRDDAGRLLALVLDRAGLSGAGVHRG
jgi:tetraacyldisaccharide 4'-kinase